MSKLAADSCLADIGLSKTLVVVDKIQRSLPETAPTGPLLPSFFFKRPAFSY
jgi:hypothetical protein